MSHETKEFPYITCEFEGEESRDMMVNEHGTPFYRSTGRNSKQAGFWFPFVCIKDEDHVARMEALSTSDVQEIKKQGYVLYNLYEHLLEANHRSYPDGYIVKKYTEMSEYRNMPKLEKWKDLHISKRLADKSDFMTSFMLNPQSKVFKNSEIFSDFSEKEKDFLKKTITLKKSPEKVIKIHDKDSKNPKLVNQWLADQGAKILSLTNSTMILEEKEKKYDSDVLKKIKNQTAEIFKMISCLKEYETQSKCDIEKLLKGYHEVKKLLKNTGILISKESKEFVDENKKKYLEIFKENLNYSSSLVETLRIHKVVQKSYDLKNSVPKIKDAIQTFIEQKIQKSFSELQNRDGFFSKSNREKINQYIKLDEKLQKCNNILEVYKILSDFISAKNKDALDKSEINALTKQLDQIIPEISFCNWPRASDYCRQLFEYQKQDATEAGATDSKISYRSAP